MSNNIAYRGRVKTTARTRARARIARAIDADAIAHKPPNFHTHIGRLAGHPDAPDLRRLGIKRGGRLRYVYEYVQRFSDPGETARVMILAAARKAALDAKRALKADRIAATEARRTVRRAEADRKRRVRDAWGT